MIDLKTLKKGDKLRVTNDRDNNVYMFNFVNVGDIAEVVDNDCQGKICLTSDDWSHSLWFKPEQLEYVTTIVKSRWEEIIENIQGGYGMTDEEADIVKSILTNNKPFNVVPVPIDTVLSKEEHNHLDATHVGTYGNPCLYYRSDILKKWFYFDNKWLECEFDYEDCDDLLPVSFGNK